MKDKMLAILRAITVLDALSGRQGRYRLGTISQWSCVPRSTCDRKLRKMVEYGMLSETIEDYRNEPCRVFAITEVGRDLVKIFSV